MKLMIVCLSVLLSACHVKVKSSGGGGGGIPDPGPDKVYGEAAGTLHGAAFKPITAAVLRSGTSGDENTYYWVRMTDVVLNNPCTQITTADRLVGFYISQANPVDYYDMSVKRGQVTGANFFDYAGGSYKVDWITTGWANVIAFDKSAGVDVLMDMGAGSNRIEGVIHAQFCN